jgi:hypothetical protein
VEGLLDTGSDETVFPESYARLVGIDLTNAPVVQMRGATHPRTQVLLAEASLQLTDGVRQHEWQAWVGFARGVHRSLLGFGGFLQFFTATFHGDREQVELSANSLYPGT